MIFAHCSKEKCVFWIFPGKHCCQCFTRVLVSFSKKLFYYISSIGFYQNSFRELLPGNPSSGKKVFDLLPSTLLRTVYVYRLSRNIVLVPVKCERTSWKKNKPWKETVMKITIWTVEKVAFSTVLTIKSHKFLFYVPNNELIRYSNHQRSNIILCTNIYHLEMYNFNKKCVFSGFLYYFW